VTKTKSKRIRARVGDVFVVPISAEERICGQVVDQAGPQFLVVLFRSAGESVEDVAVSYTHLTLPTICSV